MELDVKKLAMGLLASALTASVGFLWTLPAKVAVMQERDAALGKQLDDTIGVIDALHPRGSALAGGPPESDDEMEQRAAKIRGLLKRAPQVVVEPAPMLECPPCPCESPEPTPAPSPEPTP